MISLCVPVHRPHPAPNVATLAEGLAAAAGHHDAELVVALNGISAADAGVADGAVAIDLGVNRGVAPGWNAAARSARGDVLVFGNDDAELGPGALALLADALREHPEAGVVGPVGTRWDIPRATHLDWVDTSGLPPGALATCDVVSGFLFACRRETWEAVGGFDEFYAPASWEEVDFDTAVRQRLGLGCFVVAGVPVRHEWGISAKQRPWRRIRHNGRSELLWSIHRRNRRHFLAKWSNG